MIQILSIVKTTTTTKRYTSHHSVKSDLVLSYLFYPKPINRPVVLHTQLTCVYVCLAHVTLPGRPQHIKKTDYCPELL